MKNKILFSVASLFVLAATSLFAYADDPTTGDLGGDESRIICKCGDDFTCRVSSSGAKCAQSEEGGNIKCEEYDSNC